MHPVSESYPKRILFRSRRISSSFRAALALILIMILPALLLSGCEDKELSGTEGLSIVTKYHFESDQNISFIKRQHDKDRLIAVTDDDYKQLFILYTAASSEVNTWLGDLKVGIDSGKYPAILMDNSQQSLATATAVIKLEEEINKIMSKPITPSNPQAASDLLIRIGRSVWKDYRKANRKKKEAIEKQLDGVMWKPWQDLGG